MRGACAVPELRACFRMRIERGLLREHRCLSPRRNYSTVEQLCAAVAVDGSVPDSENVVAEGGARYGGGGLLTVYAEGDTKESVDAKIVRGRRAGDVIVA